MTGLEDTQAAEVHILLQDHGTAHQHRERLESQLSGFHTACNPDCVDIQFAAHLPCGPRNTLYEPQNTLPAPPGRVFV